MAEQRPSGRHVDIHRLIVMPSVWGSAVRLHRREMSSFLRNIRCSRPQHLQTMSGNHSPHFDRSEPLYNILEEDLTEIDDALGPMRSPDVVETPVVDGREVALSLWRVPWSHP